MKRLTPLLLAAVLLAGCGGDEKRPEDYPRGTWKRDYAEMHKSIHGEYPDTVPPAAQFDPAPTHKPKPKPRPKPKPVTTSSGAVLTLTPRQRELFIEARTVCGLVPAAQVAGDFGMDPNSSLTAISRRYARAYKDLDLNSTAEFGCYSGLVDRQNKHGVGQ